MASDYIIALEERCYTANKTSLELLTRFKFVEDEIETLKSYCTDLKSRIANYIPIKNDAVDKALADYINNLPNRNSMKIMFLRMAAGAYEFGTQKIGIKVA